MRDHLLDRRSLLWRARRTKETRSRTSVVYKVPGKDGKVELLIIDAQGLDETSAETILEAL